MHQAHLPYEVVPLLGRLPGGVLASTLGHVDHVAVERPLTIMVRGRDDRRQVLAVTMRTPGDDLALAIGLCLAEGILASPRQLLDAQQCAKENPGHDGDTVLVTLDASGVELDGLERHVVMHSGCGLCGRTAIDDVARRHRVGTSPAVVAAQLLAELPRRLRVAQELFEVTGGLHAVALFDTDGRLAHLCEDVGRHNAFDKVVGRATRAGSLPLDGHVALLSGRASYELVAKAAVAGIPIVAAIGAPSSLAIDLAQRCGITLVGFLRQDRGNVYTHPHRIHDRTHRLVAMGGA